MGTQKVANNPLGSYPVLVDRTADGDEIQNVRILPTITYIDEVSASVSYYGFAAPGSLTSTSDWRIIKKTVSGAVTSYLYAGGSIDFDKIWDNRASYTYS